LAFQRYSRINQKGEGDDILAGNCLAVVGLYKALYGINPRYNRLYLNPRLPAKLSGTELMYHFRKDKLKISLSTNCYTVSNGQLAITSQKDFGYASSGNELYYFDSNNDTFSIAVKTEDKINLSLNILKCETDEVTWNQVLMDYPKKISYVIGNLKRNSAYTVIVDNKVIWTLNSDSNGTIKFDHQSTGNEHSFKITGLFDSVVTENNIAPGKNIVNAVYKTGYSKYDAGGKVGLYDGERGTTNLRDGAWQGFEGEDMEVTFELATQQKVYRVTVGFLESPRDWIYLPVLFEVYTSVHGIDFQKIGALTSAEIREFPEDEVKNVSISLNGIEAKYVKIVAKNIHSTPEFDPIAGGKEWIFCDEVMIE
jgi:hypothetical protein